MYNNNDINNTWEGDNNVLYQQATKYVLDNAQKAMKGKKISSPYLEFLADVVCVLFSLPVIPTYPLMRRNSWTPTSALLFCVIRYSAKCRTWA